MRDYLLQVLKLTGRYRLRFGLGLLCGFLSGALAFTLPVSLKLAVDTVFPREIPGAGAPKSPAAAQDAAAAQDTKPSNDLASRLPAPLKHTLDSLVAWFRPTEHASRARLILVIALIPGSMLLRSLLAYLNTYMLSWVGIRAANDLRVALFRHLINLPLGFFGSTSTGDLMTRNEGAMAVHQTITGAFSVIIREPISVVVLICTVVFMQPLLSLFTLMVFPLCLIPVVLVGRKTRKSDSGMHQKFANLSKVMHESFTGIRVIKAYNLESLMLAEFRQAADGLTSFFMRSVRQGELPGPLIEFVGSLGVALVFAYYAFRPGAAPAGDMLSFFIAVFGLYAPVKNLSRLHHQLRLARTAVEPVYQMLAVKSNLPEPAEPKALQAHGKPIRFKDIRFSYDANAVLHDINLTIQPGQLVALVGRTGSGKTSLVNLLLRFYDPQAGAVLIGDTDVRSVASRDLRNNVAVVTQTTILFNETIGWNIGLGRPGATQAEIQEAARHAYAHDFIMEKPEGYNSPAGEKGAKLSGGQQQRVSIARAILKNAPILILDEATSALDNEAERIVQAAIEELMIGRTTICIAHRLSTVQKADLIVVLDGGRIVETGTHAELIKKSGIYKKLYELSFKESPAETEAVPTAA
jgi:subfamily B ATP-binding cassette protein MsbA